MGQRHWSIGKTDEREAAVAAASRRYGIDGITELLDKLLEVAMNTENRFVLETISRAYGPGDTIPWDEARREGFPTLAAADSAMALDAHEMRERCGPRAWDSHRRIVALFDTKMTAQFSCMGTVFREGHALDCANYAEVQYTWPANTPQGTNSPDSAPGWHAAHQCEACYNLQQGIEARMMEEDNLR